MSISPPPYSNPGNRNTRGLNPGVRGAGGLAATAAGVLESGELPTGRAQTFNIDTSGIDRLKTSIQGVIDKFTLLDTKITGVVTKLQNIGGGGTPGRGGTGPGGPGNDSAPVSGGGAGRLMGMAAGAEVLSGWGGYINQRMSALSQGIPIQQMAMQQNAMFGGRMSIAGATNQYTGINNLGMADLGQAMAMQQTNPALATAMLGGRNFRNYQGFMNAVTRMNPSGGATFAGQMANELTSPQASWFWQTRMPRGGLYNATTGQLNDPSTVFRSLVQGITMNRNLGARQAQFIANDPRRWMQASQVMNQIGLDPGSQYMVRQYMAQGMNLQKAENVLQGSQAQSYMKRLTAGTQTGMDIFNATTNLQNTINNLAASFQKFAQHVPSQIYQLGFASAFAAKTMMGIASQVLAANVVMKGMGLRGGLGGLGGFPGMGPGGTIGTAPAGTGALGGAGELAGVDLGARFAATGGGAATGLGSTGLLGMLAGGGLLSRTLGRGLGSDLSQATLGRGMFGKLIGGKGLGLGKGLGASMGGAILGQVLESLGGKIGGGGGQTLSAFGGAASGAGTGMMIGGPWGALAGALLGFGSNELQSHFGKLFQNWSSSSNPFESIGGSILSGVTGLFGDPGADTTGMQPNLASGLNAMMAANPNIRINSGYRTKSQQANLYALKGGRGVARPNQSPHQLGKAADLGPPSQLGWIAANARAFGLNVDKGEPWHVQAGDPKSGAGGSIGTVTGSQVVSLAESFQGVPYSWGGTSPSGFDCSGLVQYVYAKLGINLPRTSQAQANVGTAVGGLGQAQPGDLLFYNYEGPNSHVAIYVGNNQQVAAPHTGTVVQIQGVDTSALSGIRRVVGGGAGQAAANAAKGQTGASSTDSHGGGSAAAGATAPGLSATFVKRMSGGGMFGGTGATAAGPPTGGGSASGNAQTNTAGNTAQLPAGNSNIKTPSDFSKAVLAGLGVGGSVANVTAVNAWQQAEGQWGATGKYNANVMHNPLNTFFTEPGSVNLGQTVSYPNWAEGIQATVSTIKQGNMAPILQALQSNADLGSFTKALTSTPWAASHYPGGIPAPQGTYAVGDPAMSALFTGRTSGALGGTAAGMTRTTTGRSINVTVGPIYVNGTQADAQNIASMVANAIRTSQDMQAVSAN